MEQFTTKHQALTKQSAVKPRHIPLNHPAAATEPQVGWPRRIFLNVIFNAAIGDEADIARTTPTKRSDDDVANS